MYDIDESLINTKQSYPLANYTFQGILTESYRAFS